jgi:hypothetical protein
LRSHQWFEHKYPAGLHIDTPVWYGDLSGSRNGGITRGQGEMILTAG